MTARKFTIGTMYIVEAYDHHSMNGNGWNELDPKKNRRPFRCLCTIVGYCTAVDTTHVELSAAKAEDVSGELDDSYNSRWTIPIGTIKSHRQVPVR